jgi:hypothetical protein
MASTIDIFIDQSQSQFLPLAINIPTIMLYPMKYSIGNPVLTNESNPLSFLF